MGLIHLVDDLYRYNDWANAKVFALADGLTDEQLDHPREMGFGSLRATLFHIQVTEQIWLERWKAMDWRKFPIDPEGKSLDQIKSDLKQVAQERQHLIDDGRDQEWNNVVGFLDSKRDHYEFQLCDLLVHVVNHGIHHRAQALNYLKQFERTVPGVDYIFYRLAHTTVEQAASTIETMADYGIAVAEQPGQNFDWNANMIKRMFNYHEWANQRIFDMAEGLDGGQLDHDFAIGHGSIRKTLLHLYDAENWWLGNWKTGPHPFHRSPEDTSLKSLRDQWSDTTQQRDEFISNVDQNEALRAIEVHAGGPPTQILVGEAIVQLACHGVHHRAQLINMLRHSGVAVQNIDLMYALSDLNASSC